MTTANTNMGGASSFWRRLRSIAFYCLLLLGLVGVIDWWRSGAVPNQVPAQLMTLQSIDGKTYDLAALSQTQPTLVYFWGTWCPVCPTTSPTIDWFGERYPVLSIAMSSGDNQRIQQYLDDHDYQFPTVNDRNNHIASQWGVQVTPTIAIVIDNQVVSVTTGVTTPVGLQARLWLNQWIY